MFSGDDVFQISNKLWSQLPWRVSEGTAPVSYPFQFLLLSVSSWLAYPILFLFLFCLSLIFFFFMWTCAGIFVFLNLNLTRRTAQPFALRKEFLASDYRRFVRKFLSLTWQCLGCLSAARNFSMAIFCDDYFVSFFSAHYIDGFGCVSHGNIMGEMQFL